MKANPSQNGLKELSPVAFVAQSVNVNAKCRRTKRPIGIRSMIMALQLIFMTPCAFLQWISIQHASTLPQWHLDEPFYNSDNGTKVHLPLSPGSTSTTSSSITFPFNDSKHPPSTEEVAIMPQPRWEDIDNKTLFFGDDSSSYTIEVPLSLAGCEPKFIVRYHENGNYVQQEYFFKPAWASYVALNELVAYHVDQLLGFHRVPPVVPMQIPYNQKILPALKLARQMQLEHHVFKKCRMKLEDKDIKEWIKFSPKRTDNLRDKHDDSLVVIGSMQLQVPDVIQRNKMVRYVDKRLKRSELLSRSMSESLQSILVPRAPSIFAERELGTRAIFDYLIGNRDRFHNDHILSMAEGENRILVYIDNNRVQIENTSAFDLQDWTRECRFYYAPVQKLFELCRDRPAIKGRNRFSLGCNGLTQRLWSHIMHHQPNSFETMISSWAEPPRPILRYEDIPFFSHLPKRVGHIIQRVEDCLRQKGFHHVFVEQ